MTVLKLKDVQPGGIINWHWHDVQASFRKVGTTRESQVESVWGCVFKLEPSVQHEALFQPRTLVASCLCNAALRSRKSSLTLESDCSAVEMSPSVVIVLGATVQ